MKIVTVIMKDKTAIKVKATKVMLTVILKVEVITKTSYKSLSSENSFRSCF